jgi:hypothetical protein
MALPESERRPGGHPGPAQQGQKQSSPCSASRDQAQALRRDPRFHRLCRRLNPLGPRPLGELLLELVEEHGIGDDILWRLEFYNDLSEYVLDVCDGSDWPPPPLVLVAGGSR